jgi:cell pole-organizing protein PopZ
MEDILASIRRIIAEDQSSGVGRSGLAGFARRTAVQVSAPVVTQDSVVGSSRQAKSTESLVASSIEHEILDRQEDATQLEEPAQGKEDSDNHQLRGSLEHLEHDEDVPAAPAAIDTAEALHAAAYHAEAEADAQDTISAQAEPVASHHADFESSIYELRASDLDSPEPLISPVAGASVTSSFQALANTVLMQDPGLVERIMRETLRPMLKTWLDDHLPSLVERLVRAEIERVARGGRSRD